MVTIVKLNPGGEVKVQYQGEIVERLVDGVVIQAYWQHPTRDLEYVTFEPGDCFIEYYYVDCWFNILDIASTQGTRKGWYCNIAEPAVLFKDRIEQVDLFLDVWVDPAGKYQILDEDEFAEDTTLNDEQRSGAQRALQGLIHMILAREGVFSCILEQNS